MIKIIEPGTKTVAECNSCGCKFSYEKEDIQSRPYKVPDGFVPSITKLPIFFESYVTCPQCGKTMTVKSQK
jgi:hypothetical protein